MFHWKDGWFFERMPNDSVMITKRKDAGMESPIVTREIIPSEGWASVVASVSIKGESDRRWFKALDFHNGRDRLQELYPRAFKLMDNQKSFLVVASHEPYYKKVYEMIREQETQQSTWTDEDERIYQACVSSI
jgi:hypothetical protein